MEDLINKIITGHIHCYFVSPHTDDAAFSAGGLISFLAGKTRVTVVNVFSSCGNGKNSLSARAYLRQAGFKNARRFYQIRSREDNLALTGVGAEKIDLGFTDALWRRITKNAGIWKYFGHMFNEFNLIYPFYNLHIIRGKVSQYDLQVYKKISRRLQDIVNKREPYLVFCPAGFGQHVDHIIVRNVCTELFKSAVIYWSDMPYFYQGIKRNDFIREHRLVPLTFNDFTGDKYRLANCYRSQINQVIPDRDILYYPEVYYLEAETESGFEVRTAAGITEELLHDWRDLWDKSAYRTFYNSPDWFLACISAFKYTGQLIITCYSGGRLVGILPLVVTPLHGVKTFASPGGKYLDKSTMLLLDTRPEILNRIFSRLSGLDSFYLTETPRITADTALNYLKNLGVTESSFGLNLMTQPNPLRFIRKDTRRRISDILNREGSNISFRTYTGEFNRLLPILTDIENRSHKKNSFMDVFNNPHLTGLLSALDGSENCRIVTSILYFKEQPVCFLLGFQSGGVFYGFDTAYVAGYDFLMPGKLTTYFTLSELTAAGIRLFDFSRGDGRYKRDFMPFGYKQYSLYYSRNLFIRTWWKTVFLSKSQLEQHHSLYEAARMTKNYISRKFIKK